MNRKLIKYLLEKLYRPWLILYLSKDRKFRHETLELIVRQGVFHPGFFYSTSVFLKFLKEKEVTSKKILELGAGSGLISLQMAKRGARVYASDISIKAVENIKENASLNHLSVNVILSDLFDSIHEKSFDCILVNPPYYPKDPVNESEYAWFCGKEFQYFKKFFGSLKGFIHEKSEIFMILSEDCDMQSIKAIARSEGFEMDQVFFKRIFFEENYIFQVL